MKTRITAIILLSAEMLLSSITSAQQYPKGLYMSMDEINNHTPSMECEAELIQRKKSSIIMVGGNDYKLSNNSIGKKTLKKKAWAYSDGDTLYINCRKLKGDPWYARVYEPGKYLLFDAGLTKLTYSSQMRVRDYLMGFGFGMLGAAIAGADNAQKRFHYALNPRDGKLHCITLDFLTEVLQGHPAYSKYEKDRDLVNSITGREQREHQAGTVIGWYIQYINQ